MNVGPVREVAKAISRQHSLQRSKLYVETKYYQVAIVQNSNAVESLRNLPNLQSFAAFESISKQQFVKKKNKLEKYVRTKK